MRASVTQIGAAEVIKQLTAAPETIRTDWAKEAYAIGAEAVEVIKREYRTTGTEPFVWGPSSWTRSGAARRSYAHEVKRISGGGAELKLGAIRPTEGGKVPLQVFMLEGGYNYPDRDPYTPKIIRPKVKPYLIFPIRQGGGLVKSNIIRWVAMKKVTYRPRPALPKVGGRVERTLQQMGLQVIKDAL